MNDRERRRFLKYSAIAAIGLPEAAKSENCIGDGSDLFEASHDVIVIGAGAAGLSSGYQLARRGVDFKILEAKSTYGRRMKDADSFVNFPISMGAEWVHVNPTELRSIAENQGINVNALTRAYSDRETYGVVRNNQVTIQPLGDFGDRKFVNSSWLKFYERYIVPSVRSRLRLNTPIANIDYRGAFVVVTDSLGRKYAANRVIVTIPLSILKQGRVTFSPSLPNSKLQAARSAKVWPGIKVFVQFRQKFYPTFLSFPDSETRSGQRVYYDAAFAQSSSANVLGLFAVGQQALQYQSRSGDGLKNYILAELDAVFDGAATRNYQGHIVQNWSSESYINGAYLEDFASSSISRVLANPVDNKLFFAGEAYTREDDWGSVHNAARSAKDTVNRIGRKQAVPDVCLTSASPTPTPNPGDTAPEPQPKTNISSVVSLLLDE